MVAMLCTVLVVVAPPFKADRRLEAENAVKPASADRLAAKGAGPGLASRIFRGQTERKETGIQATTSLTW
jgi:hypothetical protein